MIRCETIREGTGASPALKVKMTLLTAQHIAENQ